MFKATTIFRIFVGHAVVLASAGYSEDVTEAQREAMYEKYLRLSSHIQGGRVNPNWMADGSRFWYSDGAAITYIVDPVANTKNKIANPPIEPTDPRLNPKGSWTQREVLSPDKQWFAGVKKFNLYLRSTSDNQTVSLTTKGEADYQWGYQAASFRFMPKWSPDSSKLAVRRYDSRNVPKIPVVDYIRNTERVQWFHYPTAGAPRTQVELYVIDVDSRQTVPVSIPGAANRLAPDSITLAGWTTKAKPTRARQLRKQGFTVTEIANALDVSERSVFRYLG